MKHIFLFYSVSFLFNKIADFRHFFVVYITATNAWTGDTASFMLQPMMATA
jgi:hypothetical protein